MTVHHKRRLEASALLKGEGAFCTEGRGILGEQILKLCRASMYVSHNDSAPIPEDSWLQLCMHNRWQWQACT